LNIGNQNHDHTVDQTWIRRSAFHNVER